MLDPRRPQFRKNLTTPITPANSCNTLLDENALCTSVYLEQVLAGGLVARPRMEPDLACLFHAL